MPRNVGSGSDPDINFISPIAMDSAGSLIEKNLEKLKISNPESCKMPTERTGPISPSSTGTYSSMFNQNGSIEIAGADMCISDNFTPENLQVGPIHGQTNPKLNEKLKKSKIFLADLNLRSDVIAEVLKMLPGNGKCVKILDPTSVFKIYKIFELEDGLGSFDVMTPNFDEFLGIANKCYEMEYNTKNEHEREKGWKMNDFRPKSGKINYENISYVSKKYFPNQILILTMDQDGVILVDGPNRSMKHYQTKNNQKWSNQPILNVSGSGDTFTGGFASQIAKYGDLSSETLDKSVRFGLEVAAYSLRSDSPVCEKIDGDVEVSDWKWFEVKI